MTGEIAEIVSQVVFPQYDATQDRHLRLRLQEVTQSMRGAYYRAAPHRCEVYDTPFGGPIGDSIGPWPEFILRGLPCQKSKIGCCTPCFYSRMPQVDRPVQEVHASLITQVRYILRNFDALVVRNQWGPVAFGHEILDPAAPPLGLVLTPTGSFFDDYEFPFDVRRKALTLLLEHSQSIGRTLALHIETHAEHFLKAAERESEFDETLRLLRALNARILFGWESSNDFVRNVLYNKFLDGRSFLGAVELARTLGFPVGAFVFTGIQPLNDIEVLADAWLTLDYLRSHGITPVVMFHTVQPYTMQELLYTWNAHRLPDPRTLLEIVKRTISEFPILQGRPIDTWLLADPVGGPPAPRFNVFSVPPQSTCPSCAEAIYRAIVNLRQTRDVVAFERDQAALRECHCASEYADMLRAQLTKVPALRQRAQQMVDLVAAKKADYCNVVRPIMNEIEEFALFEDRVPRYGDVFDPALKGPQLKAELLCYGLRVAPDIANEMSKFNSYIHEGGFVHAAHFLIGDHLVNTCIAENFTLNSPYILRRRDGHFEVLRDSEIVAPCELLPTPPWCDENIDGYKLGHILRPHGKNVIAGMPETRCHFFATGQECAFCSLGPLQGQPRVPAELVAHAALRAREFNPSYELSLSGGTPCTPDHGASYFASICALITQQAQVPISVELIPPEDNADIERLRESGATAIIMNLEVWDETLRSVFCPGKARVPVDRYMNAITHAITVFGRGRVASVLIAGIQSRLDVVQAAKALIGIGAIPTVIPFKPFDACRMRRFPCAHPEDLIAIYEELSTALIEAKLSPDMQPGCTRCGGCSLENLFSCPGEKNHEPARHLG
jgi:uncharacterized Fe-S cluster-containing MiaB family protein/biotin synthase-related radical SAM superfamily protein